MKRLRGARSRRAKTLGGEIAYERAVYECPSCRKCEAPLDGELGARKGDRLTLGLARRVAWLAGKMSFADAAEAMKEIRGQEVSAAECQRVGLEDGARIDAELRRREEEFLRPVSPESPPPEPEFRAERLALMADAGTVLTVKGEENKSVYCGRAFALEDRARKQGQEGAGRPFIGRSLHTASAVDFEDFGPRMKALAWRAGMRSAAAVAFVADGAACLWNWAEESLPPGTVMIQDFWHVAEHLARLCREVFEEEPQASDRLKRWKEMLLESRVGEIIAELGRERRKRRGARQKALEEEIGYLSNASHRMDYARYRAEGWPIGSGAIEADVKHLVKQRFGLTGARWRRANIPSIVALAVAIENGDWEARWSRN